MIDKRLATLVQRFANGSYVAPESRDALVADFYTALHAWTQDQIEKAIAEYDARRTENETRLRALLEATIASNDQVLAATEKAAPAAVEKARG